MVKFRVCPYYIVWAQGPVICSVIAVPAITAAKMNIVSSEMIFIIAIQERAKTLCISVVDS
jgi:maltodextrin utilization protein YvdJ